MLCSLLFYYTVSINFSYFRFFPDLFLANIDNIAEPEEPRQQQQPLLPDQQERAVSPEQQQERAVSPEQQQQPASPEQQQQHQQSLLEQSLHDSDDDIFLDVIDPAMAVYGEPLPNRRHLRSGRQRPY